MIPLLGLSDTISPTVANVFKNAIVYIDYCIKVTIFM